MPLWLVRTNLRRVRVPSDRGWAVNLLRMDVSILPSKPLCRVETYTLELSHRESVHSAGTYRKSDRSPPAHARIGAVRQNPNVGGVSSLHARHCTHGCMVSILSAFRKLPIQRQCQFRNEGWDLTPWAFHREFLERDE